jgi:adrenodoxin-NADP+ reductase
VVLAYGADSDYTLRIPGSHLPGVLSAHEFVNWYNGHPDYANLLRDKQLDLSKVKEVVVVGQGNVALDVARILAKDINGELYSTDIVRHAVDELRNSAIEKISVIGRRGHVQAAFTIKELRELTKIDGVIVKIDKEELVAGNTESTLKELENNRPKKRIADLIQQIAEKEDHDFVNVKRTVEIRFLMSPKEVIADQSTGKVSKLIVDRTKLEGDPFHQKATSTGERIELPCDLLLTSIGYKSRSISKDIPFDTKKNIVSNSRGRVVKVNTVDDIVPGMYVTGWLKRGPTGIIGSNITDAKETSACLIEDIKNNTLNSQSSIPTDPVQRMISTSSPLAKVIFQNAVSWEEAQRLHSYEIHEGQSMDPPRIREKTTDVFEMIRLAKSS